MKKTYTEEQKNEVLVRLFAGEPIASISKDTGIAKSTLYAWIKSNGKKKNKALNMTDYRIQKERCETLEITQSFSRKASPYDNSVMEAFFKTMKAEELYRNQYL